MPCSTYARRPPTAPTSDGASRARARSPDDAVHRPLSVGSHRLSRHCHGSAQKVAIQEEQRATNVDPCLVPLLAASIVRVQAGSDKAAGAGPLLAKAAAAIHQIDRVRAEDTAVRIAHLPSADPEVELAKLRRRASRGDVGRRSYLSG